MVITHVPAAMKGDVFMLSYYHSASLPAEPSAQQGQDLPPSVHYLSLDIP